MKNTLIALTACTLALTTRAALIANYTLDNSNASVDTEPDSTANAFATSGFSLSYATVGGQTGTRTSANQISTGDYYAFSVTANVGYLLMLNGATLSLQDRTDTANTFSFSIRSSVDGYASDLASFTPAVNTWTTRTLTLSGAGYDNLNSITFRILLDDGGANANSRNLYFDNVSLDGLTAVPEPATVAFLIFGGLFTAVQLRRRWRQGSRPLG